MRRTGFVARRAECSWCRGRPAGEFFLWTAKERNQRKAALFAALRVPSICRKNWAAAQLGPAGLRHGAADCPQFSRQIEAAQKGIGVAILSASLQIRAVIPSPSRGGPGWGWGAVLDSPDPPLSRGAGPGEVGCTMSERRGRELCSRPARRATQGTPKGRGMGFAFFWLLFLAKQEK